MKKHNANDDTVNKYNSSQAFMREYVNSIFKINNKHCQHLHLAVYKKGSRF